MLWVKYSLLFQLGKEKTLMGDCYTYNARRLGTIEKL